MLTFYYKNAYKVLILLISALVVLAYHFERAAKLLHRILQQSLSPEAFLQNRKH